MDIERTQYRRKTIESKWGDDKKNVKEKPKFILNYNDKIIFLLGKKIKKETIN